MAFVRWRRVAVTEYSKEEIGPAAEVQMEMRLLVLGLLDHD